MSKYEYFLWLNVCSVAKNELFFFSLSNVHRAAGKFSAKTVKLVNSTATIVSQDVNIKNLGRAALVGPAALPVKGDLPTATIIILIIPLLLCLINFINFLFFFLKSRNCYE